MKEKKNKWIKHRVTEAERFQFNALAESLDKSLSDLIRERLSSAQVGKARVGSVNNNHLLVPKHLIREIARWGNNLNQIARKVNIYPGEDGPKILEQLIVIERHLQDMKDEFKVP